MIRSLRLENFRRHGDTEIHFSEDEHLILIAGENGVGKSTILEALLFGLYGEGREGRRNLDRLVKRGYELEGMTVEVVFGVGETEYRVVRRRVGRSATAVLYGNEEPLVESVGAVSEEIGRILGMDVHAFRLAVMAAQKELDGLAAHTPAVRRKMITKLLRVDLVGRARDAARARYNTLVEVVKSLGAGANLDALGSAVEEAEKRVKAQESALAASEGRVGELVAQIGEYADEKREWESARERSAAAQTSQSLLEKRVAEIGEKLGAVRAEAREVVVTEAAESELRAALVVVERRLAELAEAEAHAAQMRAVQREARADQKRLAEILRRVEALGEAESQEALEAVLEGEKKQIAEVRDLVEVEVKRRAATKERIRAAEERLESHQRLGDVCIECGQPVTAEHRREMGEKWSAERAAAVEELAEIEEKRRGLLVELSRLEARLAMAAEEVAAGKERAAELRGLEEEEVRIRRRLVVLSAAKAVETVSEERAGLEGWLRALEAALERRRAEDEALRREGERAGNEERLAGELREAEAELAAAVEAVEKSRVSEELALRMEELAALTESLEAEKELVSAMRVERAVAEGELKMARNAVQIEERRAAERRERQGEAQVAAGAAAVLGELSERLVREVRPALGVAVSEILARLSEGRFSKVVIGDEYEILVEDDGGLRDLAELSGGERDLVALAVRLGLSALVAERHGHGGPGFLVLDECFGSQDDARRRAILDALRKLRSSYRQILLISHVGGLEEACDRVIEVKLSEDRADAEVRDI